MGSHLPDELLEPVAAKFRMLGDATRLAILRSLMEGERSVGQIVAETGRGQANVSKHLKMLADAGLVSRRKSGLQVFYAIRDPLVDRLCFLVCGSIVGGLEDELERGHSLLEKIRPRGGGV